jgi:hypothetical protein
MPYEVNTLFDRRSNAMYGEWAVIMLTVLNEKTHNTKKQNDPQITQIFAD